jgi:hypothetical protein
MGLRAARDERRERGRRARDADLDDGRAHHGVGFHDTSTRAETRMMDLELVRHLRMVEP